MEGRAHRSVLNHCSTVVQVHDGSTSMPPCVPPPHAFAPKKHIELRGPKPFHAPAYLTFDHQLGVPRLARHWHRCIDMRYCIGHYITPSIIMVQQFGLRDFRMLVSVASPTSLSSRHKITVLCIPQKAASALAPLAAISGFTGPRSPPERPQSCGQCRAF